MSVGFGTRSAVLVLALQAGGCHLLLPFAGGTADRQGPGDLTTRDRLDLSGGPLEVAVQLPDGLTRPEGRVGLDRTIKSESLSSQDKLEPVPDSKVTTGCNPLLATRSNPAGYPVAFCMDQGGQIYNQCAAAKLCDEASGYRLCWPSVYRLSYGPGLGFPSPIPMWLGGCVRAGGTVGAPTDGACSSCAINPMGKLAQVAWDCGGASATSSLRDWVGLQTETTCKRVGQNNPSTAGYWSAMDADAVTTAAACCL